jgi:hypothetical protein
MCTWLEESKRMKWTFILIRPVPFHQPPHSLLLDSLSIPDDWSRKEKVFNYTYDKAISLYLYMYKVNPWVTYSRTKRTHLHIYSFIYIRSIYLVVSQQRWTEKKREERTKKKKEKVCDGGDIFTQLPHTNRTTEVYTRIKK